MGHVGQRHRERAQASAWGKDSVLTGGAWLPVIGTAHASEHTGAAECWAVRGCWVTQAAELGQGGRGARAWATGLAPGENGPRDGEGRVSG